MAIASGSITNDELEQLQQSKERHDLIMFYEFTLAFMDAVGQLREFKWIGEGMGGES